MPRVNELAQESPDSVSALRGALGVDALAATVSNVQAEAEAADVKATTAQNAAAAAQSTANSANTLAGTANTNANTALTNAAAASSAASAADAKAVAADSKATQAGTDAASALSAAQAAQSTADNTATAVATAQTTADNAATAAASASAAASAADTKATNAGTAATAAQAAAEAAQTAANSASSALSGIQSSITEIETHLSQVNRPPTATPITVEIHEDVTTHNGSVFDHIVDLDDDVMEVVNIRYSNANYAPGVQFNSVYGTMVVNKIGTYTFAPNATARAMNTGDMGVVIFFVEVMDSRGGKATLTLTIQVEGEDDEVGGGPGGATTFDDLYDPSFQLISNTNFFSRPVIAKPPKMTSFTEPSYTDSVFGTKIFALTRVDDSSDNLTDLRHPYSRQTAFNADSTRAIARASNGWWHMFNTQTGQRVIGGRTQTPGFGALADFINECEPFWHPTNPVKLWRTGNQGLGCVWYEYDIETQATSVLFDLNPHLQTLGGAWATAGRAWFKGEGRPSNDGRYWAFQVETTGYAMIGLIMYDRVADQIIGHILTTNRPDHISTSPLGNYAVPSWYGTAESMAASATRPINEAVGARAYSQDFSTFTQLSALGEHSDLALDAQGNEVFVSVSFRGGPAGQEPDVPDGGLYYRRLDNGVAYPLPGSAYESSSDQGVHMSGIASDKPGWAVISWYGGTPATWKDGAIYAVELVPDSPQVRRICHHQSVYGGNYINEPHAVPNRDLTMVLFASNYGSNRAEDYYVGLASDAIPQAGSGRPPVNMTAPQISGTVTPGSVLTVSDGLWSGINIEFSYQWYRNGAIINGATNNTLTIPGNESNGVQYRCDVRAENDVNFAIAQSNPINVQTPSAPNNVEQPTISGGAALGSELTINNGVWEGLPTPTFSYQWLFFTGGDFQIIPDETSSTYTPDEIGDYACDVTATNAVDSTTARSATKTIQAASAPKAAVGASVPSANTWQATGSNAVPDVAIGDSVVWVVSLDEGSGDGSLNTVTATVLGKPVVKLFETDLISRSNGRRVRQYLYVADQVTQAGTATLNITMEGDSHWAIQGQRFTGGIGQVDVSSKAIDTAAFTSPHAIPAAATSMANTVEIISLLGVTDMGNAALALPAGFTSMGADQAGPLVAMSGYRVRSATGNIGGSFTSTSGGYGDGWVGMAVALY